MIIGQPRPRGTRRSAAALAAAAVLCGPAPVLVAESYDDDRAPAWFVEREIDPILDTPNVTVVVRESRARSWWTDDEKWLKLECAEGNWGWW